ncbi:histidinol dehydrogenase [Striga asiatica]|uniref:Histidinol dehydrogenase n=1 Tax=Striga asiatica TaxID=4170 RepID=A0A5A7PQS7_STRAF|nr:histidinol dehydrogenase [Striga asiatica]
MVMLTSHQQPLHGSRSASETVGDKLHRRKENNPDHQLRPLNDPATVSVAELQLLALAGLRLLPGRRRWQHPLPLLLLVADPSGPGLQVPHLPQVQPHRAGPERVRLGRAAPVFLIGGPESAHEGVEAAPRLPERTGAGRWRVGLAEKRAAGHVDLGLPELVEVAEELEHVGPTAAAEVEGRPVVAEVLPERVPVTPLLAFVPAWGGGPRPSDFRINCCWIKVD